MNVRFWKVELNVRIKFCFLFHTISNEKWRQVLDFYSLYWKIQNLPEMMVQDFAFFFFKYPIL